MSLIKAIILGIIQGICEFFPISSSSNLKFAKFLLNVDGSSTLFFDLFCHTGTLIAALIYLRKDIFTLFTSERKKLFILCCAILPMVPIYLIIKMWLPSRNFGLVGLFLMVTAIILLLGNRKKERENKKASLKDALCVGTAQSAALIPGLSRSACTIMAAKFLGWSNKESVRFSFLLSIPTILGGLAIESFGLIKESQKLPSFFLTYCILGFFFSLAFGSLTIRFAIKKLEKGNFLPFACYSAILGIIMLSLHM